MDIKIEDLPATMLAFKLEGNKEIFIAEQVVSSHSEIASFKSIYNGNLIRTKKDHITGPGIYGDSVYKKRNYLSGIIMFIIILAIIPVAIFEFCKGCIQRFMNSFKKIPAESFSG
jgi:hypothetical protein